MVSFVSFLQKNKYPYYTRRRPILGKMTYNFDMGRFPEKSGFSPVFYPVFGAVAALGVGEKFML